MVTCKLLWQSNEWTAAGRPPDEWRQRLSLGTLHEMEEEGDIVFLFTTQESSTVQ